MHYSVYGAVVVVDEEKVKTARETSPSLSKGEVRWNELCGSAREASPGLSKGEVK